MRAGLSCDGSLAGRRAVRHRLRRRAVAGVGLLAGASAGIPALAQTASQITPPTYAPPVREQPAAPLVLPADSLMAPPAGAEALFVTPGGVEIEGGVLSSVTLAVLSETLVGKRVSIAAVFAAAGAAEAAEARRGRVLLRVVVTRQDLADAATIRFAVIEGFVERIDLSGVPAGVRGRVGAVLADLTGRTDVTLAQIERRLTLAAEVPGLTLRSTLAAGVRPGGTVLRIDASWRPVTGFATVDNTLGDSLGREAFGIGIDLNSILGAGEIIYLRASGVPTLGRETSFLDSTPRNRALAAGAIIPVGSNGLTITVEGTDARTAPRHSAALPGFASRFRRLSLAIRYPFVHRRALTVSAEARLDAADERVGIITPAVLPLSLDRLRVMRTSVDVNAYLPGGGSASGRVEMSFGINGFGARSAADATAILPLSRAGSDADFTRLALSAAVDQPIARHLALALRARGQTSFGRPLGNAEQIGVASLDAISPLSSGTLQGDAGHAVRGEARAPFVFGRRGLLASVAPYAFAAEAQVRLMQPTIVERRSTTAVAYGVGLRLAGQAARGSPGLSAGIELGRVHRDGARSGRAVFSLLTRF
ncbi:ShlB/FhaC/HecB family hemolysin secretion/activation protein [Sphingomonas sp.]|uniref:ShlB/FhaC/HecB family hemolysin secretion/activation protein n=1 Tax=Sphingomonas sp. TaxID=28214 RepID=UPI003D6D26C0